MKKVTKREFGVLMGAGLLSYTVGASARPAVHHVNIERFAFVPETLRIKAGDKVVFHNHDLAPHTATDTEGRWDTGDLPRDAASELSFNQPGQMAYFCAFHPHMTGRLIIEKK